MTTINIYLNFEGNCETAFNFYKSVFGGEFAFLGRFSEMPPTDGMEVPAEMKDKIMHVSLPIGGGTVLMGSDTGGDWAPDFKQGNNFSISVSTDSKDETNRLFAELSKDGTVTMPLQDTFWGDYFGMCTDQFGINWMFSFNENAKQ